MRVISRSTIRTFWERSQYSDSEQPLRAWYKEVTAASWKSPADIKSQYRSASFLANNRVVFNVHGNKYRLVVAVKYEFGLCYIRFVGTHKQYDKIDVATI